MRATFAALLLTAALSACATVGANDETAATERAAPADRDCFRNNDIDGFTTIDDDTIKVSVSPRRDYILTGHRIGRDLRFSNTVAVIAQSGWICTGNGLGVRVAGGDIPMSAPIQSIERAPEEPAQPVAEETAPPPQ